MWESSLWLCGFIFHISVLGCMRSFSSQSSSREAPPVAEALQLHHIVTFKVIHVNPAGALWESHVVLISIPKNTFSHLKVSMDRPHCWKSVKGHVHVVEEWMQTSSWRKGRRSDIWVLKAHSWTWKKLSRNMKVIRFVHVALNMQSLWCFKRDFWSHVVPKGSNSALLWSQRRG